MKKHGRGVRKNICGKVSRRVTSKVGRDLLVETQLFAIIEAVRAAVADHPSH